MSAIIKSKIKHRHDNYYDCLGKGETHWDEIYGKDSKLRISPDLMRLVREVEELAESDPDALCRYFPHLEAVRDLEFDSVLDVGCGSGVYSYLLHLFFPERDLTFYLMDISANALAEAKRVFARSEAETHFVLGDIFDMPFEGKSVDLMITGGLIEHFQPDEQKRLMETFSRVARRQVHQYPMHNSWYWLQRWAISALHGFAWPFGFEVPVSRAREREIGIPSGKAYYNSVPKRVEFQLRVRDSGLFPLARSLNRLPVHFVRTDKVVVI